MSKLENWPRVVCYGIKVTLRGQTPQNLRAYSYKIDIKTATIYLRAHFDQTPSESDLDVVSDAELEIDSHVIDDFQTSTDIDIAPAGTTPAFLPGGIAYLREGEPGSCSC